MTYTVDQPKFVAAEGASLTVPGAFSGSLTAQATGSAMPSTESGLLVQYRANVGPEFKAVTVTP